MRVIGAWMSLRVSGVLFMLRIGCGVPPEQYELVRGRAYAHSCCFGSSLPCAFGFPMGDADCWCAPREFHLATAMTVYDDDADSSMHSNGGAGGPSVLPSGPNDEDSLPPLEKARRRRSMLPTRS